VSSSVATVVGAATVDSVELAFTLVAKVVGTAEAAIDVVGATEAELTIALLVGTLPVAHEATVPEPDPAEYNAGPGMT
jgi:hypothetical protein